MLFGFFFSSRRRHTRWTGDWSSDVCSSDLRGELALVEKGLVDLVGEHRNVEMLGDLRDAPELVHLEHAAGGVLGRVDDDRSEERRVGKECRSGWSQDHYEKKQS